LDYSPDSCMNVFTKNQTERMLAVIEKAPRRNRLVKYWCAQLPFGDNLSVELYPNPAADLVNIKVIQKTFGTFEVEVFSLTGQLISRQEYKDYPSWNVEYPTPNLPPGTYIVRVKTKDETITKRLVITR
jgi:Secretion system C-terminal sorting domain